MHNNNGGELSTKELSARWSDIIKPQTLAVWRMRGTGPKYNKRGGKITYSILDIIEYEAKNKITPHAENIACI